MSSFNTLLTDFHEGILTLTFNRPKANPLNREMALETIAALDAAGADPAVRVVVITGSGKFFCAGQDMGDFESSAGKVSYREHLQETYNPLVLKMQTTPKPVVAGVNGPAVGAGLGLALACDLRVATDTAQFRYGFTRLGLAPDSGVAYWLPRLMGYAPALAMAMLDEPLEAAQAYRLGLVSRIFTEDEFPFGLIEFAHRLAHGPTRALALTKRAFLAAQHASLASALEVEGELQQQASLTHDHLEGVGAFLQKRTPDFKGE
jgi:2-(1,2-epoxy-1,2-dihydrophenyl)acetyl-CoA isomerase